MNPPTLLTVILAALLAPVTLALALRTYCLNRKAVERPKRHWPNLGLKPMHLIGAGSVLLILASVPGGFATTPNGLLRPLMLGWPGKPITGATFSPDGTSILTTIGSSDGGQVWDRSGRLITTFDGSTGIYSMLFSPDGNQILAASGDDRVRLFDKTGDLLTIFSDDYEGRADLLYSPDASRILITDHHLTTYLLDSSGHRLATLDGDNCTVVNCAVNKAVFSPDGSRILIGQSGGFARLWDKDGRELATLNHGSAVVQVAFSPNGDTIATAGSDGSVKLWDSEGKQQLNLSGHHDYIIALEFSPDGSQILTASRDNTARLWDRSGKLLTSIKGQRDAVAAAYFSPDGSHIVFVWVSSGGEPVYSSQLCDRTAKPLAQFSGEARGFSPDSQWLMVMLNDYQVAVRPVYPN